MGFIRRRRGMCSRKLISVSGVGPNTARMVLSSLNVSEIKQVIAVKDVASLRRIKGMEKTAERIIVDLHDKIGKDADGTLEKVPVLHNTKKFEALAALSSLGLDRTKTEKLLDPDHSAERKTFAGRSHQGSTETDMNV